MQKITRQISVNSSNQMVISEVCSEKPESNSAYEVLVNERGDKRYLRKVMIDGHWALTEDHNLKLKLRAGERYLFRKEISLKGDIVGQGADSLTFRIQTAENIKGLKSSAIELKGIWAADKNNRINFKVAKSKGLYDVLRFQGEWKVGENNEVTYHYERAVLKTKTKKIHTIVFKGNWELSEKYLMYRLSGDNNSFFSFDVSLGAKNLRAASGKIKYQVGIKYIRNKVYKRVVKNVTIYGRWKFSKDLSVLFDSTYSGSKKKTLKFSIEKFVSKGAKISVSLVDSQNRPLGVQVDFAKAFSNDAEMFIALSKTGRDMNIVGGMRVQF